MPAGEEYRDKRVCWTLAPGPEERSTIESKTCVTCGEELHPQRAEKYDYCTKPDCQRHNARGLKVAAVGVNKASEQFVVLDERTAKEAASGRYKKEPDAVGRVRTKPTRPHTVGTEQVPQVVPRSSRRLSRRPWSIAQERLAFTYRDMGLNPDAIAEKLGISRRLVTQILLGRSTRSR
jgi:hypothetical protein